MSTSKQFAKGKREVPREDTRASKYYSVDDELNSKKVTSLKHYVKTTSLTLQVRKSLRPTQYRSSLQPGTVLILLAGRFRGKRVILLRCLSQGLLLVTGPYKVNGVPIRRVNARYVIATRTSVKLDGVDEKVIGKLSKDEYFTEKTKTDKGENAFYKQAEKREVSEDLLDWHIPI